MFSAERRTFSAHQVFLFDFIFYSRNYILRAMSKKTRNSAVFGVVSLMCAVFAIQTLCAAYPDITLREPAPRAGTKDQTWTLETQDTKLTIGVTREGQLCIYELSHPGTDWNWTSEPSVFSLPPIQGPVPKEGASPPTTGQPKPQYNWEFKEAEQDTADGGQRLTLTFGCASAGLKLRSEWRAGAGRGPVRHTMTITNESDTAVQLAGEPAAGNMMGELPPTLFLNFTKPPNKRLWMWSIHTDGWTPDSIGVYRREVVLPPDNPFARSLFTHRIDTDPIGQFIPYAVFDSGGEHGFYIGLEWAYCYIEAKGVGSNEAASKFQVVGAASDGGALRRIGPGQTLEIPPGFVGAYAGDLDDAGNSLRSWLFQYNVPEVLRTDTSYPKVQMNMFEATWETPGAWACLEKKFYPAVDLIAPLGFEEVMIDVGWWQGELQAPEPVSHPTRWPSGMAKAAEYTHNKGMRFGLYWNKGEDMASPEGRNRRIAHIKRLFDEYKVDLWRSDSTGGPVVGAFGYPFAPSYASVKGFYDMLDQLSREIPNFQWENCVCGGRLKDFGSMKRAVKVFNSDTYSGLHNRQAFYDTSFVFPPSQILAHSHIVGPTPDSKGGVKYAFRYSSLGAPALIWDPATWNDAQRSEIAAAVKTYKERIRPLVRNANLYHILPRPDDRNWDGIQYYDPATGKGVAYIFRPDSPDPEQTIRFKGLDAKATYDVSFEDGSNAPLSMNGAGLMQEGIRMKLADRFTSELVWVNRKHNAPTASTLR